MRTLFLTALAAVLLVACNTDINSIPDVTTTGQVVVVFSPEQHVQLLEGECGGERPETTEGGVETTNPTGRIYYGLEPGAYCLEAGFLMSDGLLLTHRIQLDVVAGAIQYVSVVPPPLQPG